MDFLYFDGERMPRPDEYQVSETDILADGSGETEAGTWQRDFKRRNVPEIKVSFLVTRKWLAKLREYRRKERISVRYEHGGLGSAVMYMDGYTDTLEHETLGGGIWKVSFTLRSY